VLYVVNLGPACWISSRADAGAWASMLDQQPR
jgi:hypothetical protein